MALVRGPQELSWGNNTLSGIEEIDVEYEQDSEDYQTLQGNTYELDGPMKVTATITLLDTDVASLAVLLPQYFVANGSQLSTGETVTSTDGAIDVRAAACDEDLVFNDLDIKSCNDPRQVLRLVNVRTKVDGIEVDNKIRKVMIKFVGEAPSGSGVMQFFTEGGINPAS